MKRYIYGKSQNEVVNRNGILVFTDYWLNNLDKLAMEHPLAVISEYRYVFSHVPSYLQKYNIPMFFFDEAEIERINNFSSLTIDLLTNTISESNGEHTSTELPMLNAPIDVFSVNTSIKGLNNNASYDCGADGIGLVSTEFLFLDEQNMDKNTYSDGLEKVLKMHPDFEYTIRLFDFNHDKFPKWFQKKYDIESFKYYKGRNFFLLSGMDDLLIMQISTLIELSRTYKIAILLPYVNSEQEVSKIKQIIHALDPITNIRIGIMLETVTAIYEIRALSQLVDFFSIGTNDLVQSYFGVDRTDIVSMNQIDVLSPSFLDILKFALIHANSKRMRMCGQLPIIPGMLERLVRLGYKDFTVSPQWVPYIRNELSRYNRQD